MDLKAIIGGNKGKLSNFSKLLRSAESVKIEFPGETGIYRTTLISTDLGSLKELGEITSCEEIPGELTPPGNNLYVSLRGIKDPQSFYQYLSRNRYSLIDSKIEVEQPKQSQTQTNVQPAGAAK